jgi:predicted nucleotidyltransferase
VESLIPGLTKEQSEKILELLQSNPAVKEIVLFGSRAKGNYREGSDIDIALKGAKITDCDRLSLAYQDLYLPWVLDLVAYETIEALSLKEHIDRVGLVLFKR